MTIPDRTARHDVIALLSAVLFVAGGGALLFLAPFLTLGPSLLGPLDQPVDSRWLALPFVLLFAVLFSFGSFLGGTAWLVIMSRVLPKQTMRKWLAYGPQIPAFTRFGNRLLDSLNRR